VSIMTRCCLDVIVAVVENSVVVIALVVIVAERLDVVVAI